MGVLTLTVKCSLYIIVFFCPRYLGLLHLTLGFHRISVGSSKTQAGIVVRISQAQERENYCIRPVQTETFFLWFAFVVFSPLTLYCLLESWVSSPLSLTHPWVCIGPGLWFQWQLPPLMVRCFSRYVTWPTDNISLTNDMKSGSLQVVTWSGVI